MLKAHLLQALSVATQVGFCGGSRTSFKLQLRYRQEARRRRVTDPRRSGEDGAWTRLSILRVESRRACTENGGVRTAIESTWRLRRKSAPKRIWLFTYMCTLGFCSCFGFLWFASSPFGECLGVNNNEVHAAHGQMALIGGLID